MTVKVLCDGCGKEEETEGEHKEIEVSVDGESNTRHVCRECYDSDPDGEMTPEEFTEHVITLVVEE